MRCVDHLIQPIESASSWCSAIDRIGGLTGSRGAGSIGVSERGGRRGGGCVCVSGMGDGREGG